MWAFRRSKRVKRHWKCWDLSKPILWLSHDDPWTIGDACQGCQVFGATGSGKSTAVMVAIICAFLAAGFGGLFLTSKPGDAELYLRYCRQHGRLQDVLMFGPGHAPRFNPIDAQLRRRDAGAGLTENIVALFSTLLEVSERQSGRSNQEEGTYWRRTNRQLSRNGVDLLVMAKGRITIADLYRLVVSAPVSLAQARSEDWQKGSFCFQCLKEAERNPKSPLQQADFELVADYFLLEFANLSDKTRSVVLSTFTSMLDVLNRGLCRELIGSETNVTPEMAQDGKIILIDMPLKVYGEVGLFVQVLWKYCFQQAQERRDTNANPRPTFIVSDESHLTAVAADQLFQTTARSSRTAVLNATQSISNYLAALGERAEAEVYSLLGNLQTQILCQQTDVRTNSYAAELIGRSRQFLVNSSNSYEPGGWTAGLLGRQPHVSAGVTEAYEFEVQPNRFAVLRKGGPPSWEVDAIVYQGGRRFNCTGRPWMPVTFKQQL